MDSERETPEAAARTGGRGRDRRVHLDRRQRGDLRAAPRTGRSRRVHAHRPAARSGRRGGRQRPGTGLLAGLLVVLLLWALDLVKQLEAHATAKRRARIVVVLLGLVPLVLYALSGGLTGQMVALVCVATAMAVAMVGVLILGDTDGLGQGGGGCSPSSPCSAAWSPSRARTARPWLWTSPTSSSTTADAATAIYWGSRLTRSSSPPT